MTGICDECGEERDSLCYVPPSVDSETGYRDGDAFVCYECRTAERRKEAMDEAAYWQRGGWNKVWRE